MVDRNGGFVRGRKDGVSVRLRVSPGARKSCVVGYYGETALRIKVAAPPVDGRANAEVEGFLAEVLGVARSRVSVVKGASSRDKVIFVEGLSDEQARTRLARVAG